MNKFFSLVTKHLVTSIAILLGAVAVLVTGISFLSTYISYVNYSKSYDEQKKVLLANTPQFPEKVFKDNEYVVYDDANGSVVSTKSSYDNKYLFGIHDAEISLDEGQPQYVTKSGTSWEVANGFKKGGSITYKINTSSNGMSDIDIYLGLGEVNANIENLIDYISIKINGLPVSTENFDLPSNGSLQQLVLKNTNLITGENTLVLETSVSYVIKENNTVVSDDFIMPYIAAVTFITNVELAE